MNKILTLSDSDYIRIADTYQLPITSVTYFLDRLKKHIDGVITVGEKIGVSQRQLDTHDESKLSINELPAYIKQYGSPEKQPNSDEFNRAWLHHIKSNNHHWEYYVIPGTQTAVEMEWGFIREMVADWHGASYVYTNSYDCTEWLEKNLPKMILHPSTKQYLDELLEDLGY